MQFLSLSINSSLQNNPRYKCSLKSENIEILPTRVIFMMPPFSKWLPTKSSNCQWSPISMKIDIYEYIEVRNWLVMMKLATTCPNSDKGVAQLHIAYDIPTRFHKVLSRHLWEIGRTKLCGRRIIRIIRITKFQCFLSSMKIDI
jgi:hypothetical protein